MTTVPFHGKKSAATLFAALRKDQHAPLSAMLELADRCNETCVHCYQVQGLKGELPTEDWVRIIDELADLGVLFLTLSGGEVTLRGDFLDLVAHARARKFAVKIFTNGLNMDGTLASALAELAVQEVQISLYSHRPEIHDQITCVPGSWRRTVEGVRHLKKAGVGVIVKASLMDSNAAEYPEYIEFVQSLGVDYGISPHLDPREDGDRGPEKLRISDDMKLKVFSDATFGPAPVLAKQPLPLERSVCGACSGNVHIEANGEIRPCTQMTLKVGDARKGIAEAWHHDREARAIRELTWQDLHGCRDCELQSYCSRCFANAQVEVNDALGPYVGACERALLRYQVALGQKISILESSATHSDPKLGPFTVNGPEICQVDDQFLETDKLFRELHPWVHSNEKLIKLTKKRKK